MFGIALNAIGIIAGGIFGLAKKNPLSPTDEATLRKLMGALTVFIGLRLVWNNLNGTFGAIIRQLAIVLISMSLGKLIGKLLHLQKLSNSIGRRASEKLSSGKVSPNDGFLIAASLFCVAPLSVLASADEALNRFSFAFVIKALTDGLAVLAFVPRFGGNVLLSVIPVVAWQGTLYLGVKALEPMLIERQIFWALNATNGFLIFCVALIILQLKKIEVTDYLPSLAIAPLLANYWK
jgi:uncharacterized membrane protein YqgA involved in biofilm formation